MTDTARSADAVAREAYRKWWAENYDWLQGHFGYPHDVGEHCWEAGAAWRAQQPSEDAHKSVIGAAVEQQTVAAIADWLDAHLSPVFAEAIRHGDWRPAGEGKDG